MIGSTPLPTSAGVPQLIVLERSLDIRDYCINEKNGSAKFRVDFACWKNSFQEKGAFDDVTFVVEGRPVYANKGYITCISPVLRAMLTGDFKEGQSDQVPITQTSAEDFVTFMRAVGPAREPVTDDNGQALYALADVYDVKFLRRDCENHLIATEGIEAIDKIPMALSLNKTDFITHLVGSLNQIDLEQIQDDDRYDELSRRSRTSCASARSSCQRPKTAQIPRPEAFRCYSLGRLSLPLYFLLLHLCAYARSSPFQVNTLH